LAGAEIGGFGPNRGFVVTGNKAGAVMWAAAFGAIKGRESVNPAPKAHGTLPGEKGWRSIGVHDDQVAEMCAICGGEGRA
jgi:hypothetical protein